MNAPIRTVIAVQIILVIAGYAHAQGLNPGEQALTRQDWPTAEGYFRKAIATDPKDGRSWYQLGTALHGLGRFADATNAFEQSAAANYLVLRSLFHEAVEYAQQGDKDKAIGVLQRLNTLGFTNARALQDDPALASLHSDGRWQGVVETAQQNATPCERTAENRQFDFWIGEWEVQTNDGQHAGDSKIQRIVNGCALLENWEGSGPGKSLNSYNAARKQWQQLWVDSSGEVHEYVGGLVNGEMSLEGPAADHQGQKTFRRMTFTPLSGGKVRQKGEASSDGKAWMTEYELIYIPKKPTPSPTSGDSSN
jgi:tetratricopeptide (TPR) repeat protein